MLSIYMLPKCTTQDCAPSTPAATHTSFLYHGHPHPWQGHLFLPSGWHLRLLHPGRIAWPPGKDEW